MILGLKWEMQIWHWRLNFIKANGHDRALLWDTDWLFIYPTEKKQKNTYNKGFLFSEFDGIFQLFHLYSSVAQLSTSLCQKMHLISFKLESWNKGGVKIKCHKCFSMKYGHDLHADTLYTVNNFLDDNCYTEKWLTKCENLTLCIFFFFFCRVNK